MVPPSSNVEFVVEIAAPRSVVWQVYTDVEAWPRWNSGVRQATRLGARALTRGADEPLGVGSRVRIRQPLLPATVWEVTEWEPPQGWVWVARAPGVQTTASHELTETGRGGTRVRMAVAHSGPLAPLGRVAFGPATRALVEREAQDLRRRCETGRDTHPRHRPDGFRL